MKNYVLKGWKYIGNHPDGNSTWERNDMGNFVRDFNVSNDDIAAVFSMLKGETIKLVSNKKSFECTKHSVGKSNGFVQHVHIIIRELK